MVFLKEESKPALEHYGVKGMHWGVRKGRTGAIATKTKRLDKVASGTASTRQKAVTLAGTSVPALVRSKGLKNVAAKKSADLKSQSDRLANGKAKVSDLLKAYGTTTLVKIARSLRD